MTTEFYLDRPIEYLTNGILIPGLHVQRLSNGGMEMSVVVKGTIKGSSTESELATDRAGHLFVGQGALPYEEMTRLGEGWGTMSTAAVAGLVVRPSTVAAFEIFNGYAAGGPSLVIDRLFWFNLVSASVAQGWNGWAQVTGVKAAPADGAFAVRGHSGKAYNGSVIAAASTTVVASGWFPWGQNVPVKPVEATVTPFGTCVAEVKGRLIVPPQCSLCLHVVAQTTASTFTQGASWYEKTFAAPQALQ